MEAVYLALIVAVPAMASPLLLAWLTNRNLRQIKREDWARQDVVAAQVEITAHLLKENTKVVAVTSADTQQQLKVIHALVNSTLTAAMQGRLDANKKGLLYLRRIFDLSITQGNPVANQLAEIEASEKAISTLELEIAERLRQTVAMEQQNTSTVATDVV